MAFYELTLQGRYFNQETINRFTYSSTGTGGAVIGSFALVSAFGAIPNPSGSATYPAATVFDGIRDIVVPAWTALQVTCLNIYDPVDFYQTPITAGVGGRFAGEGMPPTSALGFRSNVIRRDVARGMKRFAGVSENQSEAGGVLVPAFVAGSMTVLANRMGLSLPYNDEGATYNFVPAVLGKQRYNPDTGLPSPTGTAYRYYPTEAAQEAMSALGVTWQPYTTVRTQNSRQYGRGN